MAIFIFSNMARINLDFAAEIMEYFSEYFRV